MCIVLLLRLFERCEDSPIGQDVFDTLGAALRSSVGSRSVSHHVVAATAIRQ